MNYKIKMTKVDPEMDFNVNSIKKIIISGDEVVAHISIVTKTNLCTFGVMIEPGFWLRNQEDVPEIVEQLYAESLGLLN